MEKQMENRVEAELVRWRDKEERFKRVFSFEMSTNKSLMREKLRDYERIASKYKDTRDPEERFALMLLKQETNHLERQLYPNRLVRLLRRLVVNPARNYMATQRQEKETQINKGQVFQQMQQIGMERYFPKVAAKIGMGIGGFTLPVSQFVNEKERMEHKMHFEQSPDGSGHQLVSNQVTLHNEMNPNEKRQHTFDLKSSPGLKSDEAYNLLNGRSVLKNDVWMKLDFNDKDTQGNYRLQEFPRSYGYDMENALKGLPIKELDNKDKLVSALYKGDRVPITIGKKAFFIEALPQFKSFNLFDASANKVSISEVLGKKTFQQHKQEPRLEIPLLKKGGIRLG